MDKKFYSLIYFLTFFKKKHMNYGALRKLSQNFQIIRLFKTTHPINFLDSSNEHKYLKNNKLKKMVRIRQFLAKTDN